MKMKSLSVLRLWKKFFTCSHTKACKRIPSDVEDENFFYAAQSTLLAPVMVFLNKSYSEDMKALRVQLIRFTSCMEKNTQYCQPELQLDPIAQIFVHPKVRNLALFIWISEVD